MIFYSGENGIVLNYESTSSINRNGSPLNPSHATIPTFTIPFQFKPTELIDIQKFLLLISRQVRICVCALPNSNITITFRDRSHPLNGANDAEKQYLNVLKTRFYCCDSLSMGNLVLKMEPLSRVRNRKIALLHHIVSTSHETTDSPFSIIRMEFSPIRIQHSNR